VDELRIKTEKTMIGAQEYLKHKHKLADFEIAVILGDLQSIYSMMEDFADEANSSYDIQNVSGCFSDGFIEDEGYCDGDCDAVEWIGNTCKYRDECKLGYGTVWVKPNNR